MAKAFSLYWELLGWLRAEPSQNRLLGTVAQLKFSSNSLVNLSDLISNVLNVVSRVHKIWTPGRARSQRRLLFQARPRAPYARM